MGLQDTKTINGWLAYHGYWWKDEERFYKAQLTWVEAQDIIEQLKAEGALKPHGR